MTSKSTPCETVADLFDQRLVVPIIFVFQHHRRRYVSIGDVGRPFFLFVGCLSISGRRNLSSSNSLSMTSSSAGNVRSGAGNIASHRINCSPRSFNLFLTQKGFPKGHVELLRRRKSPLGHGCLDNNYFPFEDANSLHVVGKTIGCTRLGESAGAAGNRPDRHAEVGVDPAVAASVPPRRERLASGCGEGRQLDAGGAGALLRSAAMVFRRPRAAGCRVRGGQFAEGRA